MPEFTFTKDIQSSAEAVFDLIADLPNYGKWLPPSNLYKAVTEYSELPVRAGTTYVDTGTSSRMVGTITTFERPTALTFRQVTRSALGRLDIEIRYTLEAAGETTHLIRHVTIKPTGIYWVLQPYLLRVTRAEVARILERMKGYLEGHASSPPGPLSTT
jgi:uncharacterized protein YndB with AHSA1/START domain